MKKILVVVTIIAVIIVIWQLYPTEKKKLKGDIRDLEKYFETENVAEVFGYIDPLYEDLSGMTYNEITQAIGQFFAQVDSINVQMSGLKLNIDSVTEENVILASCSLGLRVLARYEGERVLAFGGIVHPAPIRAWFRKSDGKYRVYYAQY
ncbi:MAG: hypothetical protein WBE28_06405 [bacterium]